MRACHCAHGAAEMSAARKRGRPETPSADYGPRVRLNNGTAVITYRPDPERPQAPAIRAARAYVAYESLSLSPGQLAAANRIRDAVEAITGAREFNGSGMGGKAFWQVGGPSAVMVDAAADLRAVAMILGRATERAVLILIVNGGEVDISVAKRGLETMAEYWQL